MLTITEVNELDFEIFIQKFGNVIEHCPVLAGGLWKHRPFRSLEHLLSEMEKIVQALPDSGKIR